MVFKGAPAHQAAIEWASGQFAKVWGAELVSDNAWATTYCLSGSSGSSYLKILPSCARGAVPRTLQIARQLPGQVPQVIAADAERGWLLFAEHGGRDVLTDDELTEVARRFALIQAQVVGSAPLEAALDEVDIVAMPQALMDFLTAPAQSEARSSVGAAYFIGDVQARRYARLLSTRWPLWVPYLEAAASLPGTLCHGDLQARNVALKADGQVVFFDWDEAAWGPAGLSLHGLFPACALVAVLIHRWQASGVADDSPAGQRLLAYVKPLVEGGYASEKVLLGGLIGSMSAGLMRFIASFGHFPGDQDHAACAHTLHAGLSDLLELCDWLATRVPGAALASAHDYENQAEWYRARRLVEDQLAREPQHLEALLCEARLAYLMGDLDASDASARKALALAPDLADARMAVARSCLARLDLSASAAMLSELLRAEPAHAQAQALMSRVQAFRTIEETAARPDAVPRIALSEHEHQSRQLAPETLALMLKMFRAYGVVQVDNLFAANQLAELQDAFSAKYGRYFHDGEHSDVLSVGDKRFMLTMELDDIFGRQELVAPDLVLPFMQQVLGADCILSAYTAVISLPGSEPQDIHKDHSALFDEQGWGFALPTFAAQMVVPLLALDEVTGATRIYKGSQRLSVDSAADQPYQDPVVPLGSCVLLDYAVAHRGLGNRSEKVRPILNMVYSRPWFRDVRNYHLQPPLKFSRAYWDAAPESVRGLVSWWDTERRVAGQGDRATGH